MLHLDWKLIAPNQPLACHACKRNGVTCELLSTRTNFSKNKSLFPIWTGTGQPYLAVLQQYKCPACSTVYSANDGRLLSMLPAHVQSIYPVDPRYASGSFHFSTQLTNDLELLMVTYANAGFVSKKLFRSLGQQYTNKVLTFLSQSPKTSFVSYETFLGRLLPPSDTTIRQLYLDAVNSPLTPYGYSTFERYERELQGVNVGSNELVAIDWTFQAIKNFNLPGAKAMFTMNKGSTKEVVNMAIVSSTAGSQISHLLQQSRSSRKQFHPAVLYSDTTPHNKDFWKSLFGDGVSVRLGLFHLMHRIVDTLDTRCEAYWEALVKLKECFYTYHDQDLARLITALKNGTFARDGRRYTDTEILKIRQSKRWKERYDSFLRKRILPGAIIESRLHRWIVEYASKLDAMGRQLFTATTEKVANEQLGKVQWASDPEGLEMYQEIPPGRQTTHGLSKLTSN